MARCVPAKEGEGRSGISAVGYGVLQMHAGATAGGGLVWCRGEQVRAATAAVLLSHSGRRQRRRA
jgi:hypothetical protein